MRDIVIAYCGPAAIPEDLWARWNADPGLLARGEDSGAALMFLLFASPFWRFGKNSFKLGWAAHLGGGAALCGAAIGLGQAVL